MGNTESSAAFDCGSSTENTRCDREAKETAADYLEDGDKVTSGVSFPFRGVILERSWSDQIPNRQTDPDHHSLNRRLRDLEAKVRELENAAESYQVQTTLDRSDSYSDARLTLGPIIGAVTSQRAVVLIQTDRSAEVTLHLFAESVDSKAVILDSDAEGNQELASSKSVPIDKQLRFVTHTAGESGNSSSGHEEPSLFVTDDMVVKTCEKFHGKEYILSQTIKLKGGSPRAFVFGRLRPGKRHHVRFTGICREDSQNRTGSFMVPSRVSSRTNNSSQTLSSPSAFAIAAVCNNCPEKLPIGYKNYFADLHKCAISSTDPLSVLIHLGGQVDGGPSLEESRRFMECSAQTLDTITKEDLIDLLKFTIAEHEDAVKQKESETEAFFNDNEGIVTVDRMHDVPYSHSEDEWMGLAVEDIVHYVEEIWTERSHIWGAIETEALDILRKPYEYTWNLPLVRQVLANVSNLMIPGDLDVAARYTEDLTLNVDGIVCRCSSPTQGCETTGIEQNEHCDVADKVRTDYPSNLSDYPSYLSEDSACRCWPNDPHMDAELEARKRLSILRIARQILNEYQRQLWDPLILSQQKHSKVCFDKELRSIFFHDLLKKLSSFASDRTLSNLALRSLAYKLSSALRRRLEKVDKSLPFPRTPQYFGLHLGPVGLFVLDIRGSRIRLSGRQDLSNEIICEEQWLFLQSFLAACADENIRTVLICCEQSPFLTTKSTPASHVSECDKRRLLKILFDWKYEDGQREVHVLTGSHTSGAGGIIRHVPHSASSLRGKSEDVQYQASSEVENLSTSCIPHFILGPITNEPLPFGYSAWSFDGQKPHEPLQATTGSEPPTSPSSKKVQSEDSFSVAVTPLHKQRTIFHFHMIPKEIVHTDAMALTKIRPPGAHNEEWIRSFLSDGVSFEARQRITREYSTSAFLSGQVHDGVNITVGPIIGKVTSSSARVLIEVQSFDHRPVNELSSPSIVGILSDVYTGEECGRSMQRLQKKCNVVGTKSSRSKDQHSKRNSRILPQHKDWTFADKAFSEQVATKEIEKRGPTTIEIDDNAGPALEHTVPEIDENQSAAPVCDIFSGDSRSHIPLLFYFQDLPPDTEMILRFEGVRHPERFQGRVRTLPEDVRLLTHVEGYMLARSQASSTTQKSCPAVNSATNVPFRILVVDDGLEKEAVIKLLHGEEHEQSAGGPAEEEDFHGASGIETSSPNDRFSHSEDGLEALNSLLSLPGNGVAVTFHLSDYPDEAHHDGAQEDAEWTEGAESLTQGKEAGDISEHTAEMELARAQSEDSWRNIDHRAETYRAMMKDYREKKGHKAAKTLLLQCCETAADSETWRLAVSQAKEHIKADLRSLWASPQQKAILSKGSHLFLYSPPVLPHPATKEEETINEVIVALSEQIHREYHRTLWYSSPTMESELCSMEHPSPVLSRFFERCDAMREKHKALSKVRFGTNADLHNGNASFRSPAPESEDKNNAESTSSMCNSRKVSGGEANKADKQCCDLQPSANAMHYCFIFDTTAVIVLSRQATLKSSILSDEQWTLLRFLTEPEIADEIPDHDNGDGSREERRVLSRSCVSSIVLVSDSPFVEDSPENILVRTLWMSDLPPRWTYHLETLLKLLRMLSSWKSRDPSREVVLIAGGVGSGVDSVITDLEQQLHIRQILLGPLLVPSYPFTASMAGSLSATYSYAHHEPAKSRHFLLLEILVQGSSEGDQYPPQLEEMIDDAACGLQNVSQLGSHYGWNVNVRYDLVCAKAEENSSEQLQRHVIPAGVLLGTRALQSWISLPGDSTIISQNVQAVSSHVSPVNEDDAAEGCYEGHEGYYEPEGALEIVEQQEQEVWDTSASTYAPSLSTAIFHDLLYCKYELSLRLEEQLEQQLRVEEFGGVSQGANTGSEPKLAVVTRDVPPALRTRHVRMQLRGSYNRMRHCFPFSADHFDRSLHLPVSILSQLIVAAIEDFYANLDDEGFKILFPTIPSAFIVEIVVRAAEREKLQQNKRRAQKVQQGTQLGEPEMPQENFEVGGAKAEVEDSDSNSTSLVRTVSALLPIGFGQFLHITQQSFVLGRLDMCRRLN